MIELISTFMISQNNPSKVGVTTLYMQHVMSLIKMGVINHNPKLAIPTNLKVFTHVRRAMYDNNEIILMMLTSTSGTRGSLHLLLGDRCNGLSWSSEPYARQ